MTLISVSKLLSHYRVVHSKDPNFEVPCPHPECNKRYESVYGVRRHVQQNHPTTSMTPTPSRDEDALDAVMDVVEYHHQPVEPNLLGGHDGPIIAMDLEDEVEPGVVEVDDVNHQPLEP